MIELTDEEFRALFAGSKDVTMTGDGSPTCPYCHEPFSAGNLTVYEASTEAGTDYFGGEIECHKCRKVAFRGTTWYPGVPNDKEKLISELKEMIEDGAEYKSWGRDSFW